MNEDLARRPCGPGPDDRYCPVFWEMSAELDRLRDRLAASARETAQGLMDRLIAAGCHDEDWNGGDVVEVVDAWLQREGVNTHARLCGVCGTSVAAAGFLAHWCDHLDGADTDESVECPLCGQPAEAGQVREHYRAEHPGDDPAADGFAGEE